MWQLSQQYWAETIWTEKKSFWFFYNSFKSPLKLEWTALAAKKVIDVATKPTLFEQTATEPKKKEFKKFFKRNVPSPPEIIMNNNLQH